MVLNTLLWCCLFVVISHNKLIHERHPILSLYDASGEVPNSNVLCEDTFIEMN